MIRAILAISVATFRSTLRSRLSVAIVLFGFVLLGMISLMTASSLNQESRLMKDLGLFLGSLIATLSTLALCAQTLHRDLERKSLFTLVTKPISRGALVWGKYVGVTMTSFFLVTLMGLTWALLATYLSVPLEWMMCGAWWLVWVEAMIIGALAILFGSFSTPLIASTLALGAMLIGRFSQELLQLQNRAWRRHEANPLIDLSAQITELLPDLQLYNVTEEVVYGVALPASYLVHTTIVGVAYSSLCVMLACVIFSRRDLT